MKHSLHHLRWLWLRFSFPVTVYAVLWAFLTAAAWLVPADGEAVLFRTAPVVLLTVAGVVLLRVLWQDPARGTDSFWRTRPARWKSVWLSQSMFLLLFLAGPPVLCWVANGLMLGNTAAQWGYGAFDLLYIACPLMALAGVASFSRGWYSLILALVATAVCLGGGWLMMSKGFLTEAHIDTRTPRWLHLQVAWATAIPLLLLVTWAWGMLRPSMRRRAAVTGSLMFLVPLLVLWMVPDSAPRRPVLEAAMPPADGVVPTGYQDAGLLMLHGVPDGTVAILSEHKLDFQTNDRGDTAPVWLYPGGPMFDLASGNWHWSDETFLIELAGKALETIVPGNTRWYTDEQRSIYRPSFNWYNQEAFPVTGRMQGHAGGFFLSVAKLLSVPLVAGAASAENGTRLRIRSVDLEDEVLAVTLDIRQASRGPEPVPPEGFAGAGPGPAHPVPLFYFPSIPMALVVSKAGDSREFRTWQTRIQQQWLRLAVPEAEAVRGVRFTPEVLRDARLILCAAVPRGTFTVALPEAPQTVPPASASIMGERAASLFGTLDMKYYESQRGARLKQLKAMGAGAMRGILRRVAAHGHPPVSPARFNELAPEIRLADFLPELAEAVHRDPRWMNTAWINGLAEKMEEPALDVLRSTRQPLPESLVAAAAVKAGPPDYPALQYHALNAVSLSKGDLDEKGPSGELGFIPVSIHDPGVFVPLPGRTLWQRLRALPDFDWQSVVRQRWRRVFMDSHSAGNLPAKWRDYAALAGDSDALNDLLEASARGDVSGSELTSSEWSELSGMIDGIPATEDARSAWLRENRGHFIWDQSAGKYRVSPRGK